MTLSDEMQIILNVYGFIGLIPSYNTKTRKFRKTIKNTLFIIILLILQIICIWGKIKYELVGHKYSHLYYVNSATIITFTIASNLGLNNWNLEKFKNIFDNLNTIDHFFSLHATSVDQIKHLTIKYLLFQIFLLALFIYDFILWSKSASDLNVFLFFLFSDNLNTYFIANMVFFESFILRGVEFRYRAFNKLLNSRVNPTVFEICGLICLHKHLCDVVDCFNWVFGWQLFFAVVHFTVCILIWIIKLITGGYKITGFASLVIMIYWIFYFLIQGIAIATMCEKVANEGKRTITVAYKALQKHAKVPALREKFFILAQQATARCPEFTAAGFFNVNFSMLFTFVNLITTYVIVIIQFSAPQ